MAKKAAKQVYVFMSFANIHTGKNIGCCVVKVNDPSEANDECKRLNLMPNVCNDARGYAMDEKGFLKQGMELNKFYSREEMQSMGFEKA